ncbi:hypothetical protein ACQPXS_35860 [Streptomyces sp. CA-142005]|uniref:hypothetical protein n=1 Tax=Streptomyces sp. CA-142005 TaxID=3240052 RepID=UPI003D8CE60E
MDRTGLAFLTGFGLAWWLLGASALGESLLPVAALAGVAVAAGVWRTGRDVRHPGGRPLPGDVRRRFVWINALQWLAIAAVVGGAEASGRPELIFGLVAVVVGLHFLPVAALFRQPRFHVTGTLMTATGAVGCVIGVAGESASTVRMTVGVGAAVMLWGTACLVRHKPTGPAEPSEAEEPVGTQ